MVRAIQNKKIHDWTTSQQKHSRQTSTHLWNYCTLFFTAISEKEDWREVYTITLPNKGDLSNCSNYRGITLLSVSGEVSSRIMLERMKCEIGPWLRDQQAGFRPNRSYVDQIATLRMCVCSKYRTERENLYLKISNKYIILKLFNIFDNFMYIMKSANHHSANL